MHFWSSFATTANCAIPFPFLRTSPTALFTLAKYSCQHCARAGDSTFLVLENFYGVNVNPLHFSCAKALLVPAFFSCQPFPVPALFWCQPFPVPALFWSQPFSGPGPFLVPALVSALFGQYCISIGSSFLLFAKFWCQQIPWCQQSPGVSKALRSHLLSNACS